MTWTAIPSPIASVVEGYTVSSGQGTQLPDEFPDDVLVFDDAEIMSAVESADGLMVNLSSDADPDEIKTLPRILCR